MGKLSIWNGTAWEEIKGERGESGPPGAGFMSAAEYGATGDGSTEDGPSLQTFLNAIAGTGKAGVIPQGVYKVSQRLEVGSDTVLIMHGARLVNYQTDLGNGNYGGDRPILSIQDRQNVTIEGGTLDGRKTHHTGLSEYQHGIGIYGGRNITIRDVTAEDVNGDGIFLRRGAGLAPYNPPTDIVIERFRSYRSSRNGGAITCGRNVTVSDSVFADTSGKLPQAGFDIEPNNGDEEVSTINLVRCLFVNNASVGLSIHPGVGSGALTVQRGPIRIDACEVRGNAGSGVAMLGTDNVTIRDTDVKDNGGDGIRVSPLNVTTHKATIRNFKVIGGEVTGNGGSGINVSPDNDAALAVSDVSIENVWIARNAKNSPTVEAGISLGRARTAPKITRVTIRGCQVGDPDGGETQFRGLRIGPASVVSDVRVIENRFDGNTNRSIEYDPVIVTLVRDNVGFRSRNGGTATVKNGDTIAHGVGWQTPEFTYGATPTRFGVTPTKFDRVAALTVSGDNSLVLTLTTTAGVAVTTAEPVVWWAEL